MARMPSTRRLPQAPAFAPQAPAYVPVAATVQAPVVIPVPAPAVVVTVAAGGTVSAAQSEADAFESSAAAARAGGFHESSYELRLGLEVSESAWSEDLVPRDWPATR